MALEQRRIVSSYIREQEIHDIPQQQQQKQPLRKRVSSGEKLIFVLFSTILVLFSSMILHTQAQINDVNREVQVLDRSIMETKKENADLAIEVKEKSTYERVWEKAKELGLDLDKNNVKVVSGQ
ncbi:cell division protein FtsL [Sporosarcina siberiensis]|uniref:Cell division protein FtsL n=1 Tax=Sporosarcina siberiensis TaxID=1365606 RepID=A0ABW4SIY4_9BACL